jgi:uncharacterized protein YgiB involved in biofilm formation
LKRSSKVTLLVIGTIAAGGYLARPEKTEVRQDAYASRSDCERDWGNDYRNCSSSGGGHGGYYGPRYYWDRSAGYPVAVSPDGETRPVTNSYLTRGTPSTARGVTTSTISRGGFGSIARGFSAGG